MARTAFRTKAAVRRSSRKTGTAKKASAKTARVKKVAGRAAAEPAKASARRAGKAAVNTKAAARSRAATAAKRRVGAKISAAPKRKATARKPTARKAVSILSSRSAAPPHRFTVSHLDENGFKSDGLRPYAKYRDLGIAEATGGLCQAHVIRLLAPCTDEVRKRHTHTVDLQMVYVLKGWVKNEFAGHGEQMMSMGSCWLQPSGIEHTVLDFSPDCELLEIIVPADFRTTELT